MADNIAGILSGGVSAQTGGALKQAQQNQGGRSFENVLQQGANTQGAGTPDAAGAERQVSGAQLEQMRADLTRRIETLPPGASRTNALLPELIDSRTRMGLLREAFDSVNRKGGSNVNLHGRFAQVENEWLQIENIMKSNRNLSTGELLGLQARLYQVSQHVEVLSKVVDQVTGGIKTILNTNV